ncbi:hypothetical protein V6N12_058717 [Hibiscus sabdariffa]|uniref:RNase H type-1 domain-containing protein n=1 Tax=Hibiscus sabdariffa TaxID=183260 RepID=A0ABR2EVP7_9ROSI
MENPNSLPLSENLGSTTLDVLPYGNPSGRPPEIVLMMYVSLIREHPGSPIAIVDQNLLKKSRLEEGSEVDKEGHKIHDSAMGDMKIGESGAGASDSALPEATVTGLTEPKVTYANMVVGFAREPDSRGNDHGIQSDVIVVLKDDYVIDRDGHFPFIKFSEKDLYGPCMVVDNRQHRQGLVVRNSMNGVAKGKAFTEAYKTSNPEKRTKAGRSARVTTSVVAMAPGQIAHVVEKEVTGSGHNHATVTILEQDPLQGVKRGLTKGRGISLKGAKENSRQGLNIRKSADAHTLLRLVTHEWVQNISNQMTSIVVRAVGVLEGVTKASASETGLLESVGSSSKHMITHQYERLGGLVNRTHGLIRNTEERLGRRLRAELDEVPWLTNDFISWKGTVGSKFSVKESYLARAGYVAQQGERIWKAIHKNAMVFGNEPGVRQSVLTRSLWLTQEALNRPWETKLQLVSRKGNMAADRLAKMAHQPRFEVTVYEEPLVECIGVLQRDEIM